MTLEPSRDQNFLPLPSHPALQRIPFSGPLSGPYSGVRMPAMPVMPGTELPTIEEAVPLPPPPTETQRALKRMLRVARNVVSATVEGLKVTARWIEGPTDLTRELVRGLSRFRHFKEKTIEGDPKNPVFLLGGLGTTGGYNWQEVAQHFHESQHAHISIKSLPGHGGTWGDLLRFSHRRWTAVVEEDLERLVEKSGGIGVLAGGISTGGLILGDIAARRPELFRGLIIAGAPLSLKDSKRRIPMEVATFLYHYVPFLRPVFSRIPIPVDERDIARTGEGVPTRNQVGAPNLRSLPLRTIVYFASQQAIARRRASKITVPLLVAYGGLDRFVDVGSMMHLWTNFERGDRTVVNLLNSPHTITLGKERALFSALVDAWTRELAAGALPTKRMRACALAESVGPRLRPSWTPSSVDQILQSYNATIGPPLPPTSDSTT